MLFCALRAHKQSQLHSRCLSVFATSFPYGLTNASCTSSHYATTMALENPLLSRCSAHDFMGAARADASERCLPVEAYLAQASLKCDTYLSSGKVHAREEERRVLQGVLKQEGQMALLMGGKSVGKSLLLRELASTPIAGKNGMPRMVVLVNGRSCGADLNAGVMLANGIQSERSSATDDYTCPSVFVQRLRVALNAAAPMAPTALTSGVPYAAHLLNSMVSLAHRQGTYLCLVIDEGNLALPTPPLPGEVTVGRGSREEQERQQRSTQALLNHLVQLTKESRSLNVLIATSEYTFPSRLQHRNFFNTTNLTKTVVAGEVPPAPMRALLHSWGLGPRLADVLLGYLGGHVHMTSLALDELASRLDSFHIMEVAPSLCTVSVDTCLREGGSSARSLLQALAVAGWAPVGGPQDPAVQLLARESLGGFVGDTAAVVGLPPHLRRAVGSGMGAVPSFHFLRHVIAQRLAVAAVAGE